MSLEGKILISHPNCPADSVFHKAVIYIYQDKKELGTIGVITNKKSKISVKDICEDKKIPYHNLNRPVYHGGPVNQSALVLLHTNEWASTNTAPAANNLYVSSDNLMLEKLAQGNEPTYWRLFGGMCGWSPGQLDAELEGKWPYRPENSWLIAKADETLLFSTEGESQWKSAFELCSSQMFDQYW